MSSELIQYPVEYQFKAMGLASPEFRRRVRAMVEEIVGALPDHHVTENVSSAGKYVSVSIKVTLKNEEERRRVYHAFHSEKAIVWYV